MRIVRRTALMAVVTLVTIVRTAGAQPAALEPQARGVDGGSIDVTAVQRAIERGVDYLRNRQLSSGMWNDYATAPAGVTALCTLALLNSGVPPDDAKVSKALSVLRGLKSDRTYVVALQTMVLCQATPKRDGFLIQQNVKWLEAAQCARGPEKGGWHYGRPATNADVSNSQFAVLALHEAERAGQKVSNRTWQLAHGYWTKMQLASGGWSYRASGSDSFGSQTCAGIAALVITSGKVGSGAASVTGDQVQCCGDQERNEPLERGLDWLENNFSVERNPGDINRLWRYYYLYGLERVGRMTARRFIGKHDWYREGAEALVRDQDLISGFWKGGGQIESQPEIATSMALMFLSKGRRPVVAAKLQYGRTNDWNHHPNDLANLVVHTEQAWDRDLTWQVIDARAAQVEDLLQAPVLYMSGRNVPELTAVQKRKLRDYLDRGGFLFTEACCAGGTFEEGFRQLINDLFPEPEYRLRLLPPEHPIWAAEERIDPEYAKPLWGVDYGCRTSVVFCPDDLSCYWELSRAGRQQEPYPDKVQRQIDAALATGVNVLTYATGREPKTKDEAAEYQIADERDVSHDRATIRLAKLQHPGTCNAAPGALANLARVASLELGRPVASDDEPLSMTDPALLAHYHMAFMHGRSNFRLTAAERQALGTFVRNGGTLLVDSVCASRAFTASFRQEMQAIFPDHPLERLPAEHSLFTPQYGGHDITTVTRRDPSGGAPDQPLQATTRRMLPELDAITLNGRLAVIFSPYDLSCALERHDSLECQGYRSKDAARIGLNVLLYSLQP